MKMDFTKIENREITICDRDVYREFSILVPIIKTDYDCSLLFEIRSQNLNKQPSEICFPGGKIEDSEGKKQAALRETAEELLVPESGIDIIAELDTVVTPFNSILYPFAGELSEYNGTFNPDEVESVFSVPLSFFIDKAPLCHYVDIITQPQESFPFHMVQEGRNYPWGKGRYPVYFYSYEDKIIWGITARIINNLVSLLTSYTF